MPDHFEHCARTLLLPADFAASTSDDSYWMKLLLRKARLGQNFLPMVFCSLDSLKELHLPSRHLPCFVPPASVKFRLEELYLSIDPSSWPSKPIVLHTDNFGVEEESQLVETLFTQLPRLHRIEYSVFGPDNWPSLGHPCRILVRGKEILDGERESLFYGNRFLDVSL